MTGIVIQTTGASYLVKDNEKIYNCTIKGKFRLQDIKTTNPITIGDVVEFEIVNANEGAIVNIHERQTSIIRKSTNLSKISQAMAVNIDQIIFVYTLKNPVTTLVFPDRFLATAEYNDIPVVIMVNKTDIYNETEALKLAEICSIYNKIGYKTILCSVENKKGLEVCEDILKHKSTYIAGLSGVGKSSFINALVPGLNLKTADISKSHLSGKHTTTFARMISLPFGGNIIDSPGIRAFGLIDVKKETISHYFPEFFKVASNCRYYNCLHINEPDCAVKKAIENKEIAESRYKSYLNIFYDKGEKHRK